MRQILLQNTTAILLQNAEVYHKMRQIFLLQNATVLLQNTALLHATVTTNYNNFITKCDSY